MVLNKQGVISTPLAVSIPVASLWAFDVFLSCDHEDIFPSHLYHKLHSRGISTFQDGQELEKNTTTPLELFGAIEESRFAIVVLSQNYASSPQRLNELSKILECMKDRNRILPIFHDVNVSHVQKQKGAFEKAFDKHQEVFHDDLAKVNAWRDALTKVCNFAGWTSNDRNEVEVMLLSAAFDQASSPNKPQNALFGMMFAIAAMFTCIWELIHKGINEKVVLKKFGKLWWYYYPHPYDSTPFGTLPDIYGLIGGIAQCICSVTQYIYFSWHADSPIKLSLLPAIFLLCLAASRLNKNRKVMENNNKPKSEVEHASTDFPIAILNILVFVP